MPPTDTKPGASVASRIAQDIQAGLLSPGTWLKQIEMERRYGCSRGDVRRALDDLVARRLVQHVPNRGHHVFALEPRRMADLMQLRVILEGAVADLIYDRADAAALRHLDRLAAAFETATRRGTPFDQLNTNIAFHMAMLDLCPNPELAQAVKDARHRLPSALLHQWTTRGWIEQSARDHAAMVDALRTRDQAALRKVMVAHLRANKRTAGVQPL